MIYFGTHSQPKPRDLLIAFDHTYLISINSIQNASWIACQELLETNLFSKAFPCIIFDFKFIVQ